MHKITFVAVVASVVLAGCALDRADPAARSARATYGPITITVYDNSKVSFKIGDGALAAADGNGEISQPTTMTTTQSPQFTTPAGLDPVTAGIQAISYIAGKSIDAYAWKQSGKPSTQQGGCAGGDCEDSPSCPDGSCGDGGDSK